MKLVIAATPKVAIPSIELLSSSNQITIITQPDKPAGRGKHLQPSEIASTYPACHKPLNDEQFSELLSGSDLLITIGYGRILKMETLQVPKFGGINLHFSLLPRWRGAAPVERALLAGDAETGVCLMQLDEGLDTGPVYSTVRVPIGDRATADELRAELVRLGTEQLVDALAAPLGEPVAQSGVAVYADKIRAEELRIDWGQPAAVIDRLVRLGGAWTTFRGRRVKVIAAVPDSAAAGLAPGLRLVTVQPEGKAPMAATDWVRGVRPAADERFE